MANKYDVIGATISIGNTTIGGITDFDISDSMNTYDASTLEDLIDVERSTTRAISLTVNVIGLLDNQPALDETGEVTITFDDSDTIELGMMLVKDKKITGKRKEGVAIAYTFVPTPDDSVTT